MHVQKSHFSFDNLGKEFASSAGNIRDVCHATGDKHKLHDYKYNLDGLSEQLQRYSILGNDNAFTKVMETTVWIMKNADMQI